MRDDPRWRHREPDRLLQLHRLDLLRNVDARIAAAQEKQSESGQTLQGYSQLSFY